MTSPEADRSSLQLDRPKKLQRISQACDLCHRRSIRCRPSNEAPDTQCQNCFDFAVDCTYNRPSKRRKHGKASDGPSTQPSAPSSSSVSASQSASIGTPVGPSSSALSHQIPSRETNVFSNTPTGPGSSNAGPSWRLQPDRALGTDSSVSRSGQQQSQSDQQLYSVPAVNFNSYLRAHKTHSSELSTAWRAFATSCETAISELLAVYMDIVYPTYPLFHESRLETRIRTKEYLHDRGKGLVSSFRPKLIQTGFFAAVMAACALVSARVSDKAVPSSYQVRFTTAQIPTDTFYSAAADSISKDMMENPGIEYMRACTLLALTCLQRGNVGGMQQYVGTFYTLVAVQRFFDENHWPRGLSDIEIEINRRVYWSTYCLDVSASAIWSGFIRSQELHTGVRYPGEVIGDKDDSTYHSDAHNLPRWTVGWQFTIDLHRVMEHILNKFRARQFQHSDRRGVDHLVFGDNFNEVNVMQTVLGLFYNLPSTLKETPHLTGDKNLDVYGYQAANIQATLQLLRMIMLTLEDNHDVERRCEVVGEVLGVFSSIPIDYLRAINTPLIYHLGTIGQTLMAVRHEDLSETTYRRLRAALVTMADLLDNLGPGVGRFIGPSQTIRQQIVDLDASMRSKRSSQSSMGRTSSAGLSGPGATPTIGPQGQQQQTNQPQVPQLPQLQQQAPHLPHLQQQQHHHSQHQQQTQQSQQHHQQQPHHQQQQQRGSLGPPGSLRSSMAIDTASDDRFGSGLVEGPAPRPADYATFPPELMGSWSMPVIYDQHGLPPMYQHPPASSPH